MLALRITKGEREEKSMTKELAMKSLWFLFILLNLMPLLPGSFTLAQGDIAAQTETQIVFVANATRQTIDRMELTSNAPAIQSISGVGTVKGLQLAGDVLYSFTTDDGIYATQLDKGLNSVTTCYLGNVGAAGSYTGNSIHVEKDGSILTAGRCGVASFTQQAGTLVFQAVRFSGENVVRLATDTKNRLYVLTVGGAIYQVPQSRDWSAIRDTGWRIPRPSGFQVDGKKLIGAVASTQIISALPICPSPDHTAAALIQPESKSALIPDGVSGLVQAKPNHNLKVIAMGAPLALNPVVFSPSGIAVLNGAGFIIGNRTDQQPGSELFSFTTDGAVMSVLQSGDEFTDIVFSRTSQ
jgi:hypothetical protein